MSFQVKPLGVSAPLSANRHLDESLYLVPYSILLLLATSQLSELISNILSQEAKVEVLGLAAATTARRDLPEDLNPSSSV